MPGPAWPPATGQLVTLGILTALGDSDPSPTAPTLRHTAGSCQDARIAAVLYCNSRFGPVSLEAHRTASSVVAVIF